MSDQLELLAKNVFKTNTNLRSFFVRFDKHGCLAGMSVRDSSHLSRQEQSMDFNEQKRFSTRSNVRYIARQCEFLTLHC